MTSRFVALGLCALDALATLMTFVQGSATVCLIVISLAISLAIASFSGLVQSLLKPKYFWDQVPHGRGGHIRF